MPLCICCVTSLNFKLSNEWNRIRILPWSNVHHTQSSAAPSHHLHDVWIEWLWTGVVHTREALSTRLPLQQNSNTKLLDACTSTAEGHQVWMFPNRECFFKCNTQHDRLEMDRSHTAAVVLARTLTQAFLSRTAVLPLLSSPKCWLVFWWLFTHLLWNS